LNLEICELFFDRHAAQISLAENCLVNNFKSFSRDRCLKFTNQKTENFHCACCKFENSTLKKNSKVFISAIYNSDNYQQDVNSSGETNHSGGKQT